MSQKFDLDMSMYVYTKSVWKETGQGILCEL